MNISLHWLNRYLEPGDVDADEAERLLTSAGFPIESRTQLPDGDVLLDVEVTSNRGDCLSHLGCAREIAASSTGNAPRRLTPPAVPAVPRAGHVRDHLALENREPGVCPLFTARLVRGVKVGPSPEWLVNALEAVGQRSINNVVDVTNFITFELGNPCHVFDLDRLAGRRLVIRYASEGEKIRTLDERDRVLKATDLVVADAERAQSLAGVIGGADSEVHAGTTDVVFEMATWDPVTIRTAARRMAIRTDAGYRFERGVDPRSIEEAAERALAMLVEVAGGQACEGALAEGRPFPEPTVLSLRPSRCAHLIGIPFDTGEIENILRAHEITVERRATDELRCTIPPHRLDLTREIDLVEEVVRTRGLDAVPVNERITVAVRHPQDTERAKRELGAVLTGQGFFETVTFSFVAPERATPFLADGLEAVAVDDERRKAEPTLRPSVLPSLLACRRANQDALVDRPGGVRLFETAAVFAQDKATKTSRERRVLALLADVPGDGLKRSHEDLQHGLRLVRGVAESLVEALGGTDAELRVRPGPAPSPAWRPDAAGAVHLADSQTPVGVIGLIAPEMLQSFGLDIPVVAAELDLDDLLALFPPRSAVHALPAFPAIERDVSLVVDEDVPWQDIEALVSSRSIERLEGCDFVGAYRGRQVGAGRKSVTLRLRFRDPARTLRREEVEPEIGAVVQAARKTLNAEVRA